MPRYAPEHGARVEAPGKYPPLGSPIMWGRALPARSPRS